MKVELPEHLELCAALAAGSLDSGDRAKYAEHLADGCDECDQLLPAYERATLLIAAALPLSAPASSLRERVLAAANGAMAPAVTASSAAPSGTAAGKAGPRVPPPPIALPQTAKPQAPRTLLRLLTLPTSLRAWMAISGACLLVALVFAVIAWNFASQAKRMHDEVGGGTEVITRLNEQLQDAKLWGELFTLPDARMATLESTSRAEATMRARAVYDPRSQRALMVFSGLRAPRGKAFQLWSIEGPHLSSLGIIKADGQGRAVVRVEQAGDPNRLTDFGVSLEDEGGSSSSTGPVGPLVLVGKIEG
jgi:hypothetical protein